MSTTTTLARSMSNTLARMAWLPIIGTRLSAASNILWATADRLEQAERDEAVARRDASKLRHDLSVRDGIIADQQDQLRRQGESRAALLCLLDIERERNARLVLQLGQRRQA